MTEHNLSDPQNPIYAISPEQGIELRRLYKKAIDSQDAKSRSLANRLLYCNEISHRALWHVVCTVVDETNEKIPEFVQELFAIRDAGLAGKQGVIK